MFASRKLLHVDYVQQQPEAFRDLLRDSETAAQELEDELGKWQLAKDKPSPPESLPQGPPIALPRTARRVTKSIATSHSARSTATIDLTELV